MYVFGSTTSAELFYTSMAILLPFFLFLISVSNKAYCTKYTPYNAIFSFGDSYADTGNFVILMKGVLKYDPFEHSPYGITYFGHPMGRSCNGRLPIDFVAQELGLTLVRPYLGKHQDFHQGANFAVIGSTALSLDYFRQHNITNIPSVDTSLNVQLGWFNQLKSSMCNTTKACEAYFKKSLFIIGELGGNDCIFALSAGKSISEVKSYVPIIIDAIRAAAESLLKQGARHIVFPGNVPMGCIPVILTFYASTNKSDYDHLGCLKHYNSIGLYHNKKLKEALVQLKRKYPDAKISYADYYKPVIHFLRHPQQFGFSNGSHLRICCGGGGPYNYNISAACGDPGVSACSNPSSYINWDGVHLTEAAYRIIATGWMKGPFAHPPILSH